jgi:hypothetical protein
LREVRHRRSRTANRPSHSGQSLIEVACGCLALVPIALLVIDVVFVLGVANANSQLAQTAARLAGNKATEDEGESAAKQTIADFSNPGAIGGAKLQQFEYDQISKLVTVQTQIEVRLPVPLPGASSTKISTVSTQPIVAIPASR